MADKQKPSLAFRLATGDKAAKREVAPKRKQPVRPNVENVSVHPTYGLVFDPTGQQSDILSEEQKAARDLYLLRAGQAAAENASARDVLESGGFLNPAAQRVKGQKPRGKTPLSPIYASAADALDAIGGAVKGPLGQAIGAQTFGDYEKNPLLLITNPVAQTRFIAEKIAPSPIGLGPAAAVTKAVAPEIAKAPMPAPTLTGTLPGVTVGEGVAAAGKALGVGLGAAGKAAEVVAPVIPVPSPAAQVASVAAGKGYLSFGDVFGAAKDPVMRAAQKPNDFIDVTRKAPIVIPGAGKDTIGGQLIDLAKSGRPSAELDTQVGSSVPFSPDGLVVMRNIAQQNGWDVSDWDKLSTGEQIYRTVNEKNDTKLFWRSLLRQVGEMAAVPASVPAIIDASANALGGDTESAKALFKGVIEPYVQANETYKKRGFWAASGEFIRDNPVDAITAFMSAAKGVSRVAGAASRAGLLGRRMTAFASRGREITVPGVEYQAVPSMPEAIPLPERVVPRGVGSQAAREAIDQNRRIDQLRADIARKNEAAAAAAREQIATYEQTGQMVPMTTPPLRIGVAGKGLAGTAYTQYVKAPIVRAFPLYRRYLERRIGARPTRLAYNEAQGQRLEIEAAITRALGEGASQEVKNRAAFNLLMPGFDAAGTRITPAYVADFFRAELDDLRSRVAARGGKATSDEDKLAARLEAAIVRHDQLDAVDVPAEAMNRVRAEVKPIGEMNDAHMAAAMGISLEDAKRLNIIRVVAMDPRVRGGLEETARAKWFERNAAVPELVRIQERLKRRSFAMLERARVTGYGKYGPKKSRRAFRKAADQMFADLRRGVELATINGNEELRVMFQKALDDLSAGRLNASDIDRMGSQLVADIRAMQLTPEQVKALPSPSRMEYQAAERLAVRERAAEAERTAALTEAGLTRVTKGGLAYAEDRLARVRADYEAYNSLPTPDAKVLEKKRLAVEKEQKARDARLRALTASDTKRKLAREKQKRLDRAVLESGTGVMDTPELRAVLDVSERFAVMEVKGRKDLMYRIDRLRGEAVDDFVKRLEAQDEMPAAHVVQTPDFENIVRVGRFIGPKRIDISKRGFIPQGRFKESEGYLFVSGQETANYWDSLIKSTTEVRSAAVLQERMGLLVEATSTPVKFSGDAIATALARVRGDSALLAKAEEEIALARNGKPSRDMVLEETEVFRDELGSILKDASPIGRADIPMGQVKVLNAMNPKAKLPSERISFGNVREVAGEDEAAIRRFTMQTLDNRSLNPNEPGVYYLMPRSVYDGIQNAIRDETYRISQEINPVLYQADRITRLWRGITLNVLPRTAINNTVGSMILAAQAGAGPKAMYYAWMAIHGRPVKLASGERALLPVPRELRQRYYEQMTDPIADATGAFKPIASWMNRMRYLNGMSEDLGRLAVWYHKAYPEAMRRNDGVQFFSSAQRLTDKSMQMLEAMSRRDPNYRTLMDEYVQQSFDFLGDLHRGGPFAAKVRIFVPFWQWYLHMLRLTFVTMPFKYPKRAMFLQMLGEIGRDYQERMGVTVPWGESIVPFFTEVVDTPSGKQEYVGGVNLQNWWPESTVSVLGGQSGEFGLLGFAQGAVAPMWTDSALIAASLLAAATGGGAIELDDRKVIAAAKDEYGLPIEEYNSALASYVANKLFRMFPLSPTIMSLSGRASNAMPLPGYAEQKQFAGEQMPEALRQPQRADVLSVLDDWKANLPDFLLKAFFGTPVQYLQGRGGVAAKNYLRDYQAQMQDMEDRSKAILEAMLSAHGYDQVEGKNR